MKTLVVYYSLDGNTKDAAEKIASTLSADLLRLVPEKDIPTSNAKKFLIGGLKASIGAKTKLKSFAILPSEYDRIIIGTPIWASMPVPAINTFLCDYNVNDKIVGLFTCAGGGDNDKCVAKLSKKLPKLQQTVALADRNTMHLAAENANKLDVFIDAFL